MRLIYDYNSFRSFLKDYYLVQKKKVPSFSYGVFARQCGLSSPAHIQLILSGKRNLTVHNLHRVAEALVLPQGELDFFEALVHQNQAETPAEKKFYERRLEQLRLGKPLSSARIKVSRLLSNAYFPAILLSIEGKEIESAVAAASPRFGYSQDQIRELLNQLLREGVIELVHQKIRLSQRHLILRDQKTKSQAQKSFLRQQTQLSVKAFERMYEQDGKFFAHTFTLSHESLEQYTQEIHTLIERITKLSDEEPNDTVMQLNVQLFPYERNL